MRAALVIAGRELRATLATTTGWLVATGYLLVAGVLWLGMLDHYIVTMADQINNPYAAYQMNLSDQLVAPWFGNLTVVLLVVCPALTMRLFAEEVRLGTLELLVTSPVSTVSVVVGKFLGVTAFLATVLAISTWLPLSVMVWGSPDPGVVFGGFLALLLMGASVLALGMLASAFTDSQVVALVLAFAASMCLWIVGWVDPDPTSLASQLSLSAHLQELLRGGLRLSDVTYYLCLIGWCLFATHQRVEAYRYA